MQTGFRSHRFSLGFSRARLAPGLEVDQPLPSCWGGLLPSPLSRYPWRPALGQRSHLQRVSSSPVLCNEYSLGRMVLYLFFRTSPGMSYSFGSTKFMGISCRKRTRGCEQGCVDLQRCSNQGLLVLNFSSRSWLDGMHLGDQH